MYLPKQFEIEELVSRNMFNTWSEDNLWAMFDENILMAADWIKSVYSPSSPVTINNWKWGGTRQYSGLRRPGDPYYNPRSMHSVGKALDMVFKNVTAEEIRKDLRLMEQSGYKIPFFTRVEDDVSWLHIDTRPTGLDGIYFFKP